MGGAPGRIDASPSTPTVSTIAGRSEASRPRTSSTVGSHSPSASTRPVTPAFVASVTCSAPAESTWATQVSTVPNRSECAVRIDSGARSTSHRSLVADWLGARRMPSACRTRQSTTVRRSCQPMPGPIARPVASSQRIVVARWFVIPTPSTGPDVAVTSSLVSRTASAIAPGSSSTTPGSGVAGNTTRCANAVTVPSGATRLERTELVPTSTTRTCSVTNLAQVRGPTDCTSTRDRGRA